MTKTTEKLAKAHRKAEAHTDYILTRLVAFPFSWIVALIVVGLAVYGAFKLML